MAQVRIVAGRSMGRNVRMQSQGAGSRLLPFAPREFSRSGGAEIASIERQGRKDLTRVNGPRNEELSFKITLGKVDWTESIQEDLGWLIKQYDEGRRVKFSNMPAQFSGWWMIQSMGVDVSQLTPTNRPSRAEVSFTLVEAVDFTGKVQRQPPRPPKKPKAPKAKKQVARYHTVVKNDWLSKLAVRYLGRANRWPEIYRLNKAQIDRRGNPDLIFPGQRFKIPPK